MKTLEQILFNHISKDVCVGFETGIVGSIKEAMKEYANEYAKEALRLASHSVRPKEFRFYDDYERCEQSIISENNLPKHR